MMNLCGLVALLLLLPGSARRSIRIFDSHNGAQWQDSQLANGLEVSSESREALIPGDLRTGLSRRVGPRAGALNWGSKQHGGHAKDFELQRSAPWFRFGPNRANVALLAARGPEEGQLPPGTALVGRVGVQPEQRGVDTHGAANAVLGRRSAIAGVGALAFAAGSRRAAVAEVAPLSPAELLSVSQYLPALRQAGRALDRVRPLAEQDNDRGYEQLRIALRSEPINQIRKAATKLLKEIRDDSYRAKRSAQYDAIIARLTALDDLARPGADRSAVNMPEQVTLLQKSIDAFTEGYSIEPRPTSPEDAGEFTTPSPLLPEDAGEVATSRPTSPEDVGEVATSEP